MQTQTRYQKLKIRIPGPGLQASKNLENLGLAAAHTLGRRRYLDWSKVLSNNKETIMSRLRAEHYIANLINCLNNQRLSIPSAGNASNTH